MGLIEIDQLRKELKTLSGWLTHRLDAQQIKKERKRNCQVKRRTLCFYIGLDFLFQNVPIITAEKRTVKPGNAFEDIAFRVLFEIVKL